MIGGLRFQELFQYELCYYAWHQSGTCLWYLGDCLLTNMQLLFINEKCTLHWHFRYICPLTERKVTENRTWKKKRWQKMFSEEPCMVDVVRNSPSSLKSLVLLWGGRALLRASCSACCRMWQYLSDYDAVCINAFNDQFHQSE